MMKLNNVSKILFVVAVIILTTMSVFSQVDKNPKNVLPPPLKELLAVHHPNLDGVEKDVRMQIISFQQSLLVATRTSPTTREKLADAYGTMGEIYHAYAMLESAKESYTNASRLTPKNFKWQYLLGKLSFDQNNLYDAIDHFNKAQRLSPNYLPVYVNLGNVHLELDLLAVAKSNYDRAIKFSPKNPAALYGLGQIAYSERNFAEAVDYFKQVLQILPEANRVHYSIALAYRGLKDIEKAKFHIAQKGTVGVKVADPLYENLLKLKQGTRLKILRGKQAYEAGRFEEARSEYEKVLQKNPNNIAALVNLGSTYVKLGKGNAAVNSFQRAITLEPRNINARYNLAILLALQNKHFQAIEQLKEILKIDQNDMEARFLLAKELRNANLLNESLSEFSIVLQANQDNEDVILEGINLLTKMGDFGRAKAILENSYAKFPNRTRISAALAFILATAPDKKMRDGKKSLEIANKVYNETKLVQHGAIVALAYAELGRCAEAEKLTKALLDVAAKANRIDLINKLKTELNRYQTKKPCN